MEEVSVVVILPPFSSVQFNFHLRKYDILFTYNDNVHDPPEVHSCACSSPQLQLAIIFTRAAYIRGSPTSEDVVQTSLMRSFLLLSSFMLLQYFLTYQMSDISPVFACVVNFY